MKTRIRLFLALLLVFSAMGVVRAQDNGDKSRKDVVAGSAEPETFNTGALFLGTTSFRNIILDLTCAPPNVNPGDLGPGDKCIIVSAAPTRTNFSVNDIAHIMLPGNSTNNILLFTTSHNFSYEFNNTTAGQSGGLFRSRPNVTIESDALKDPRAIDPGTGMPAKGKLDNVGLFANRRFLKKVDSGEIFIESLGFSSTLGFSKSTFTNPAPSGFGLPADIVDKMFSGDITIRLNVEGSAKLIDTASITVALRLMGNSNSKES